MRVLLMEVLMDFAILFFALLCVFLLVRLSDESARLRQAKAELAQAVRGLEALDGSLYKKGQELDVCRRRLADCHEKCEGLANRDKALSDSNKALSDSNKALSDSRQEFLECSWELRKCQEVCAKNDKFIAGLRQKCYSYSSSIETRESELAACQKELNTLKWVFAKRDKTIDRQDDQIAGQSEVIDNQRMKIKRLEGEIASLVTTITWLGEASRDPGGTIEAQRKVIADQEETIIYGDSKIGGLRYQSSDQMVTRVRRQGRTILSLRRRIAELEKIVMEELDNPKEKLQRVAETERRYRAQFEPSPDPDVNDPC